MALALATGMFAQALARHLKIPGIVLLLGTGGLLGPDGLNVVRLADLDTSRRRRAPRRPSHQERGRD